MSLLRVVYTFVLLIISPFFLIGLYRKKNGKPSVGVRWKEHFGLTPPLLPCTKNQDVIWIHAVSVGEVIAITPFIKKLHQQHPEKCIVITTTTPTGAKQAEKLGYITFHRYMPLDFPFAIKNFIRRIQPNQLIIMETELWPNLLIMLKKRNIPISLINARLSEKSYRSYKKIKPLINMCLSHIDHIYCQYETDKKYFSSLGVNDNQMSVTGSMKYDINITKQNKVNSTKLRQRLGQERPIWIAASTHLGEDEIAISTQKKLLSTYPNILLILVPRHPERFNDVYALCTEFGLNTQRRTDGEDVPTLCQVYLADTMGEMLLLLGASDLCFMGGSFVGKSVGGHNILEPAALGIPTIIGPSYYNFQDITLALYKEKALEIAKNHHELYDFIKRTITNNIQKELMANQAKKVVQQNMGAIEKTLNHLFH